MTALAEENRFFTEDFSGTMASTAGYQPVDYQMETGPGFGSVSGRADSEVNAHMFEDEHTRRSAPSLTSEDLNEMTVSCYSTSSCQSWPSAVMTKVSRKED
jgi:hypothetical protein